jgi:hypothetical protein
MKIKSVGIFLALLTLYACTAYNPSMYSGYDILAPSDEVQANPLGYIIVGTEIIANGGKVLIEEDCWVITDDFLMWVLELKEEVKKLRKKR